MLMVFIYFYGIWHVAVFLVLCLLVVVSGCLEWVIFLLFFFF